MTAAVNEHENLKSATAMTLLDKLSCVGLLGGTTASVILQNAAIATVPISILLTFQIFSRQQKVAALVETAGQTRQSVAVVKQEVQANASNSHDTFQQQEQALDSLVQDNNKQNLEMIRLKEMLEEQSKGLAKNAGQLDALEETLTSLKQITAASGTVSQSTSADSYFTRGIHQEKLGHLDVAIEDYSQAINLQQDYAEAYLRRGIAKSKLGRKQSAVIDFNLATKHFFESGDLVNYQRAKDIASNIHKVKNLVDTQDSATMNSNDADKAEVTTINDMFGE